MTRGRKPTPVALKLVQGNPGKRAIPKPRPAPPPKKAGRPKDAVTMPHGLDAEEKKIWNRVVKSAPVGVLTRADEEKLTAYVKARRLFDMADAFITPELLFREWGRGIRAHPAVKVRNDASDRMARLLSDLGFDPTARARLGVRDEEPAAIDDDEARFFG